MKKYLLIAGLVITLLLVINYFFVQSGRNEIAGDPPVKSVETYKHWVTIKPIENTKLEEFVDTKLFHNFVPGLNFEVSL